MNHVVEHFLRSMREKDVMGYAYPGADEAEITTFEQTHGITLPPPLRELYLHMNGQESEVLNAIPYRLLPLAEIAQIQAQLLAHIEQHFGADWAEYHLPDFEDAGAVHNVLFDPLRIPVFQNANNDFYCLDYAPAADGLHGQIIAMMGAPEPGKFATLLLMFDTFEECLEDITADISDDTMQDIHSFFAHTGEELEQLGELMEAPAEESYDAQIRGHIEHMLGHITHVWHEAGHENGPQVRTYYLPPDEKRPFQLLISSGMDSGRTGAEDEDGNVLPHRTEVMMLLPPDWPPFADNETAYWPLHWTNIVAHLPHEDAATLGFKSLLRVGEDKTLPGTPFTGFLMYPPQLSLPPDFTQLQTLDGTVVTFYALIPLHPREIAQCEDESGMARLFATFSAKGVTECVDVNRPDYADL